MNELTPEQRTCERIMAQGLMESIRYCSGGVVPNRNRRMKRAMGWAVFAIPSLFVITMLVAAACGYR